MSDSALNGLAIKAENLTKRYRGLFWQLQETPALDGLDLEVPRGTVFGFLGPNGAGKTTTIKLLIDLIRPSTGKAWILGRPSDDVKVREKVGYLPDSPSFGSYLTANQFLTLCARLLKIPKKGRQERIDQVLDAVKMSRSAKDVLGGFSRGMIQRIGIAQALLNRPNLLILDEPLIGLDPHGREELLEIVRKQKRDGVTVFFCSHILSDVERLCDRIGILCRGHLLCAGRLADLLENQGVSLTIPKEHEETAKDLMGEAQSANRLGNGSWRLAFDNLATWERLQQKSLPDGIMAEPRKEGLQELFFRRVKAVEGDLTGTHADGVEEKVEEAPAEVGQS